MWSGGHREAFPGGKANQILVITQGTGTPVKKTPCAEPVSYTSVAGFQNEFLYAPVQQLRDKKHIL